MTKFSMLFGWVFLLFACTSNTKFPKPAPNSAHAEITSQYNQIESLVHKPLDTLKSHLAKMDSASKDAANEYKAMTHIGYGIYHLNQSAHVLAQSNYEQALELLKDSDADTLKARAFTGLGGLYKNTGDHPKAFDYLYKAQRIYEDRQDNTGIAIANGHIAQTYLQKSDIKLAKEHLEIAMNAMAHNKSHHSYMNAAHTLANIYGMAGEFDKALAIDDASIRVADSINSPKIKAPFLDNKANCFLYSGRLDSAQYYFNECLRVDLIAGNPKQIGDTYCNLGNLALFKKDYAEAERNVVKSISLLKSVDHKPNLLRSYETLSDVYRQSGRLQEALQTKDTFFTLYQKMMNDKAEASLAEYRIVHDTEQKEKIISQNRIELLEKQREVKQRNSLLIGISLLAMFIAVTGFLIYRQQKLKNRQQQHEHELKTAISQIETQNKLQEQRLSISRDLHDNIGAQLTFIISSVDNIRYAFDLKDTKLETRLQNINNFTKSTIIELRDTIWAMNNVEISFEDLRTRIFNFIEKAKDATEKIEINFNIDNGLDQVKLTSITAMNVYRTIQEAINNAVKYANADRIDVSISRAGNQIIIVVADNGIGFDVDAIVRGNGLANMKKRVEDINGLFSLQSEISKGTRITITIDQNVVQFKSAV